MNYVIFKNEKVPIFNSPLSNTEILDLKEKYDKFLIKDVRLNKIKYISRNIQDTRFRIDLGYKPMLYFTALVFVVYNYVQTKKKIKKVMPFSFGGDIDEFIKASAPQKNGAAPIEL